MSGASAGRERGFTLTECCVAIAIAAVLVTMALPSFSDSLQRRQLEGRAAELSADLQFLRTEAVARRVAAGITVGADARGSCYVLYAGPAGACTCAGDSPATCDGAAQPIKRVFLPAGGPVRLTAAAGGYAAFHPVRGNASPGNTFTLTDNHGREVRHVVSPLGRVRSCTAPPGFAGYASC